MPIPAGRTGRRRSSPKPAPNRGAPGHAQRSPPPRQPRNAARSTGPKSDAGKRKWRCNALKHGWPPPRSTAGRDPQGQGPQSVVAGVDASAGLPGGMARPPGRRGELSDRPDPGPGAQQRHADAARAARPGTSTAAPTPNRSAQGSPPTPRASSPSCVGPPRGSIGSWNAGSTWAGPSKGQGAGTSAQRSLALDLLGEPTTARDGDDPLGLASAPVEDLKALVDAEVNDLRSLRSDVLDEMEELDERWPRPAGRASHRPRSRSSGATRPPSGGS